MKVNEPFVCFYLDHEDFYDIRNISKTPPVDSRRVAELMRVELNLPCKDDVPYFLREIAAYTIVGGIRNDDEPINFSNVQTRHNMMTFRGMLVSHEGIELDYVSPVDESETQIFYTDDKFFNAHDESQMYNLMNFIIDVDALDYIHESFINGFFQNDE